MYINNNINLNNMNEDRKIQEEPAKRPPMEFPKEPHKDVPNEMPDIDEKEVPEDTP